MFHENHPGRLFSPSDPLPHHFQQPDKQIGHDNAHSDAFHEDKQAGRHRREILSDRRMALDGSQKRGIVRQEQHHKDGERKHSDQRSEHPDNHPGSIIVGRVRVLAQPRAQGEPQETYMDHPVKDAQVVVFAQTKQVHDEEKSGKAGEHKKAVAKSDVFHNRYGLIRQGLNISIIFLFGEYYFS